MPSRWIDIVIFALQILAWAKISVEKLVPTDLSLVDSLVLHSPKEIRDVFRRLSTYKNLGEDGHAFDIHQIPSNFLSSASIVVALNVALDAAKNGLLKDFVVSEDTYLSILNSDGGELLLPEEVNDLMIHLAGDLSNKTVYCPYDSLCLIARRVGEKGGKASVETMSATPIPWLTNIFTGSTISIRTSQPIVQPGFLQDGKLQQFDISIAFPPFGQKFAPSVLRHDPFNRFKIQTTSGSVLHLSHIVSQTKKRAVIAVQNSLLFGRGAEHSLREYLLEHHMIEKVISMPPALLPFTTFQFSILVLNIEGTSPSVRFVNGGAEQFFTRDGRNRSKLVNWESLIETIENSRDEALVVDVTVDNILNKNGAPLEVPRYLLPKEQKIIQKVFQKYTIRPLGELVQFIRPAKFTSKDDPSGNTIFEVGVEDFPNYGYISTYTRTLILSHDEFTDKIKNSFLRPHDIVITIKGKVGKVGIIPPKFPIAQENAWVISQSCLILRAKSAIDPRVLLVYLRSDIGQTLLASIVSGSAVPLIQLNQLKELDVIVPIKEEGQSIIETFEHEIDIQAQVEEMNRNLEILKRTHWSFED